MGFLCNDLEKTQMVNDRERSGESWSVPQVELPVPRKAMVMKTVVTGTVRHDVILNEVVTVQIKPVHCKAFREKSIKTK